MDISDWLESDAPAAALAEKEAEVDPFAAIPAASGMTSVADVFGSIPALDNAPAEVQAVVEAAKPPTVTVCGKCKAETPNTATKLCSKCIVTDDIFENVPNAPDPTPLPDEPKVEWTDEEIARRKMLIESDLVRYRTLLDRYNGLDAKIKSFYTALETKGADIFADHAGAKKELGFAEDLLRKAIREFCEKTQVKKINGYLSAKKKEWFEVVDLAAATTWCQESYPAALVTQPNMTLLVAYLEGLPEGTPLPAWAKKCEELIPQISKKFEKEDEAASA